MVARQVTAEGRGRAVLIYDGACPICSTTVEWIEKNEREGAFEMLPCQADAVSARFPQLDRGACMNALQLVLPDGNILTGEKALPDIMNRLRNYNGAAGIFRLPGARTASRAFYRWFADRRYAIARLFGMKANRNRDQR